MSYKDTDIVRNSDNGIAWILRDTRRGMYVVMIQTITHSISCCGFSLDDEGLSKANATADRIDSWSNEKASRVILNLELNRARGT